MAKEGKAAAKELVEKEEHKVNLQRKFVCSEKKEKKRLTRRKSNALKPRRRRKSGDRTMQKKELKELKRISLM